MRLRQRLQLRDSGDHGAGSSGAAAGADLTEENGEHRSREAQRIWSEMAAVEELAKIDLECEEASFFGSSIVVLTIRENRFGLLGTENLMFVFADAPEHGTIPVRGGAANSGASSGPPDDEHRQRVCSLAAAALDLVDRAIDNPILDRVHCYVFYCFACSN